MSKGQGNIVRTPKVDPSNAPPFAATSADNGLSVDPVTGRIVLGGTFAAPSQLLSNRAIDMNGFSFRMDNGAGFRYLAVEPTNQFYSLGDGPGTGNGLQLTIDDSVMVASIVSNFGGGANWWNIDALNHSVEFGDIFSTFNGMRVALSDFASFFHIDGGAGNGSHFAIDAQVNTYALGDMAQIASGLKLLIDAAADIFTVENTGGILLQVDPNGITTDAPASGAAPVKLGTIVNAASAPDPNNYWEIEVNGVTIKVVIAV